MYSIVTHLRHCLVALVLCICIFCNHFHIDWLLFNSVSLFGLLKFQVSNNYFPNHHQYHHHRALGPFVNADWESWWTYEGISGPDFWGRLNPKWSHCSKGHRQSPIDIETKLLLFDPNLEPVRVSGDYIKGQLINTGRGISVSIQPEKSALISGGPFSYVYTLSNLTLHFGRENNRGSEHTIDQMQFPGELQLYAYNSQLYANWSEAKREPNGIAAISVFIVLAKNSNQANSALKHITNSLKNITRRGQKYFIDTVSVLELLPTLKHYVTYEGSLTQPACHETVHWVILNKPIYISPYQFHMLRHSLKGDGHQDNFRPTQLLNKRPLRASIVHDAFTSEKIGRNKRSNGSNEQQQQQQETESEAIDTFSVDEISVELSNLQVEGSSNSNELNSYFAVGEGKAQPPASTSTTTSTDQWTNNADLAEIAQLLPSTVRDSICSPDQMRLYGYREEYGSIQYCTTNYTCTMTLKSQAALIDSQLVTTESLCTRLRGSWSAGSNSNTAKLD